jgi:phosphatidylserine/phosphatidylglycerophosphate/cardiolipin synthase-like enzyme
VSALASAIAAAAEALPDAQVDQLARALELAHAPDLAAKGLLDAAAQGGQAQTYAAQIYARWKETPGATGPAIALALRSAHAAARSSASTETVEIAWTGPSSYSVPVRRTVSILLQMISHAESQLIIVSFAAYKVPAVLQALDQAASRGVEVWLVLESAADSAGALEFDAKAAFRELEGRALFLTWPAEQRVSPGGLYGALHAKAVIVDEKQALVTSANLTGNALEANMELGLLVAGGQVPARLAAHFAELVNQGVLRDVS